MTVQQLWSRFDAWRAGLSAREQSMVFVMTVLVSVVILYWGCWKPLHNKIEQAESHYRSEQTLNLWVTHKANMISQLRQSGGESQVEHLPFNQVIANSTTQYRIQLIRIQPRNDSNQVWIEPLPFNRLLDWLNNLNHQYGITVDSLDIERSDTPGVVGVNRLILR